MPIDAQLEAALPPGLRSRDRDQWVNWHKNLTQPIDGYLEVTNPTGAASIDAYRATTATIQALLDLASEREVNVRPFGGSWSFSEVATTPGWMVDTAYMNWIFPVGQHMLTGRHAGRTDELFLVQAGTKISQLNRVLEKQFRRSLVTSGASNGQTIAGAISTGTHGSAIDHGAIHSHVVGIHLVNGPNRHVWLERASDPTTQDAFAGLLEAELLRDDEPFNAALVSFGSLGFIAGVMIETVPLFRVRASRDWRSYDQALKNALSLDFSELSLPDIPTGVRPYFFMPVINPFDLDEVSVAAMATEPYNGEPIDYARGSSTGPGYELLSVLATLTDAAGGAIPLLVRTLFKQQLERFSGKRGTLGETFDFTTPRAGAAGAALGLALGDVVPALETMIDEQRNGNPAPLIFAARFVRNSGATLEFTRHPMNCVIDLDGAYSDSTVDFLDRIYGRLETEGIAFTQHWGKLNDYDADNVRARYGDDAVSSFRAARHRLLPHESLRRLFANPFLERIGLAD